MAEMTTTGTLRQNMRRAWARFMGGAYEGLDELLAELRGTAAREDDALLVVESTALRGLLALERGDINEGLAHARRSVRMAAAEGLSPGAHLAHLALARARRHAGNPHLAARILTTLVPRLSHRWHSWLKWELILAGVPVSFAGSLAPAPSPSLAWMGLAGDTLQRLLTTAAEGDRATFDTTASDLLRITGRCSALAQEARALVELIDLRALPSPAVARWRRGETTLPPAGLHGVWTPTAGSDEPVTGFVVGIPGAPGARILGLGIPLLGRGDGWETFAGLEDHQARVGIGLARLILVGSTGLPKTDFFRAVYGFSYNPGIHKAVLDMLLHRMRRALVARGELVRNGDRLSIALRVPVLLPDPRCAQSLEARLLHTLAAAGPTCTEDLASALGQPVRTVQSIIHQLVIDGVCRSLRAGRRVRYQVEDTTFADPAVPSRER